MVYTLDMLEEAQRAYHALLTGTKAVEVVDQNGERVRFNNADLAKLRAYIDEMTAVLFPEVTPVNPNGPVGYLF